MPLAVLVVKYNAVNKLRRVHGPSTCVSKKTCIKKEPKRDQNKKNKEEEICQ
jgi:hypothetical protein